VRPLLAAVLLAAVAAGTGCAPRQRPYRFRGPVVSAVNVGELRPGGRAQAPAPPPAPAPARNRDASAADRAEAVSTSAPRRPADRSPVVMQRDQPLAAALLALVGERQHEATPLGFVFSALDAIGAPVDAELRALTSPEELVAAAEQRGALSSGGVPLLGDLVVFDDVVPHQPASALGVVVAVDDRGVVEFVYLARGVVRRGFLDPQHPAVKRDGEGRIQNIILRQEHGGRDKGVGDLAGQLRSSWIRLERLLAP